MRSTVYDLSCDYCTRRECSDDLTPDWNGETGAHLSCESLARVRADNGYRIVRFYRDAGIRRRVIVNRCTLAEAQRHCSDPETSSSTATSSAARARTRRVGPWFDGYEAR